jgi:hypothetical protein
LVNLNLKKRFRMVAEELADFSARVLRPGFRTQAGRDGVPLVDAMRQSAHKSIQQAASYNDQQEHAQSKSTGGVIYSSDSYSVNQENQVCSCKPAIMARAHWDFISICPKLQMRLNGLPFIA